MPSKILELRRKVSGSFNDEDSLSYVRTNWSGIDGKPTVYTPAGHTHSIAQVDGLQGALNTRLHLTGGVMTGPITMGSNNITGNNSSIFQAGRIIATNSGTLTHGITSKGSRANMLYLMEGATGGLAASLLDVDVKNTTTPQKRIAKIGIFGNATSGTGGTPAANYLWLSAVEGNAHNVDATLKVDSQNRVGIALSGANRPTQALDVGDKIRMRTATVDADGDDIVVTKGYMLNKIENNEPSWTNITDIPTISVSGTTTGTNTDPKAVTESDLKGAIQALSPTIPSLMTQTDISTWTETQRTINASLLNTVLEDKVNMSGAETISGLKTFSDGIAITGQNNYIDLGKKDNWFWTRFSGENWTFNNTFTGGGWARNLMEMKNANPEPTENTYFRIGAQGSGQNFTHMYIGPAYNNYWLSLNDDRALFSAKPQYAGGPTVNNDLTRKKYVDDIAATKQNTITGGASSITSNDLAINRVLVSDNVGKVVVSALSSTELGFLSGVDSNIQTQLDGKQYALGYTAENAANKRTNIRTSGATDTHFVTELGVKNYVDGVIGSVYRPSGDWNAATNAPALANNTPANSGKVYRVSTAGTRFGFTFAVGDKLAFNENGVISKWDNVDDVVSVNGETGTVVLTTDDINEGSNLYVLQSEKNTWNGKAESTHSHSIAQVTGLQGDLDSKAASVHSHTWSQITEKPTWIGSSKPTYNLGDLSDVSQSSIAVGQVLTYTSSGVWQNRDKPSYNLDEISEGTTYKRVTQSDKNTWSGKQNALGYTPENIGNRRNDIRTSGATNTMYVTELGVKTYVDGVGATKQATITGAASTITTSNLTTNRALISNGSGKVAVSAVTSTELGYLDGVTSGIQTQLNNKLSSQNLELLRSRSGTSTLTVHTNTAITGLGLQLSQGDTIMFEVLHTSTVSTSTPKVITATVGSSTNSTSHERSISYTTWTGAEQRVYSMSVALISNQLTFGSANYMRMYKSGSNMIISNSTWTPYIGKVWKVVGV